MGCGASKGETDAGKLSKPVQKCLKACSKAFKTVQNWKKWWNCCHQNWQGSQRTKNRRTGGGWINDERSQWVNDDTTLLVRVDQRKSNKFQFRTAQGQGKHLQLFLHIASRILKFWSLEILFL